MLRPHIFDWCPPLGKSWIPHCLKTKEIAYYSVEQAKKLVHEESGNTVDRSDSSFCKISFQNFFFKAWTDAGRPVRGWEFRPLVQSKTRGGSRIPRWRGANPPGEGAPTYDFATFSKKLHEIEKILDRKGAPSVDPPLETINEKTLLCCSKA